jgi:outer membrane lipoprotein-sorting protein
MNMKRLIGLYLCLSALTPAVTHAQKAEGILGKAAAAYEQARGISATIAVNIRAEKQGGSESFEGNIEMKGDKFRLTTPDMQTWYDGKTLWIYMKRTNEVNITNPSGDELQTLNPLLLLRQYDKGFKLSYVGESTSDLGKMADDVKLVAKGNDDIETVDLQIDRATSLPVRIAVAMKNDVRSAIRINRMKTGVNQPDAAFVFNAADYPGVLKVDLR